MSFKKIKVHKMFEEFHRFPVIEYIGEYDELHNLISLFNTFHQKLSPISGTLQWALIGTDDIFFVEEDPNHRGYLD